MSFLARYNPDGAPVDANAHRGAREKGWRHVWLGRSRETLFSLTGVDPDGPPAPTLATLDERYWLVGHIRLDAREALCAALGASVDESDGAICLRAYERWGELFLDHLRGDFCFAIWDDDRRRLVCARDQLGVRPLYESRVGGAVFVSDSLQDIRANAPVSRELDEAWIADFLAHGFCIESDRTAFRDIRRVPPAHMFVAAADGCELRRYWSLAIGDPIFHRHARAYYEQFHELLSVAIRDRMPDGPVGLTLSGGLDSTTLAAGMAAVAGDSSRILAETRYFEHLIPDDEKYFSALAADRLDIRQNLRSWDDAFYDRHWRERAIVTPEPTVSITAAHPQRAFAVEMSRHAQVWFFGEGPDNALRFDWRPYMSWLRAKRDWPRLARAVFDYMRIKRADEWRATFGSFVARATAAAPRADAAPIWLREEFARDVGLEERLRRSREAWAQPHPWRPTAMNSFASPIWQGFFDGFDPAVSGTSLEWRHPYLDLRVLGFLLSVPPVPWARHKLLMRKAMKGILPDEILSRPKTPLILDPVVERLRSEPLSSVALGGAMRTFVDERRVPEAPTESAEIHELIRIQALDLWLKQHGYD